MHSARKPLEDDSVSLREEREMREKLRDIFATEFPNPERRGCPENARAKLKALAWRRKFPEAQELISHLGSCSPCYREHGEYLRQRRSRQRLYELAAVAVLTVGVTLWISWRLLIGPGSTPPDPPAIVRIPPAEPVFRTQTLDPQIRKEKLSEVQLAVLDLRKRGITRGSSNNSRGHLTLPRGRLKLSIYLPIGSEEGAYEVRISGRGQSQRATGHASFKNYVTVLTIGVDTTTFETGRYVLAIRQAGWGWYRYLLQVK